MATAPMLMSSVYQGSRGAVSVMGMARSMSTPPSSLGRGTWMRNTFPSMFSRSLTPNSLSTAMPPSLSSSTPSLVGSNCAQQTRGFASKKHKRVIALSKGFRGRAKNCFRVAIRRLEKSWQYAYRDRKVKKREFRKLWIQRVNAGVRQHGVSYSRFIEMQGKSGVTLDRKILSGLAMYEPFSFKAVVDVVQKMSVTAGAGK
eukprot:CAMPEP_0201882928 /NCGR_PEP_ID=MMETSP0902-20130614/14946_1 /ASSEMBLY_ACC=CAM_ASM_000551 /TAXON_ID=420261 /ORGANISM="Thalassiosira antarctica, Strain CCMP982" /LENGTH=200 /DNA_ID=CAMNT_0048411593 /DNA_START=209 /DNA_END=811 /DNA_ORIENTATION=+